MAARAIWKGVLKIGSASVPVKMYAAVEDRGVHFHMLQNKTKSRVKQQMVTEEEEQVEKEEIRKGYEIEPGTFVLIEAEELQKLKPKESRTISFPRFVPISALGNEWYERPYYLGPDGEGGKYFALVEALEKREVLGIAKWTMRGKAYVGALRVEEGYLALIKLRYAQEVLSARELPAPGGRQLEQKELRMAEELVGALEGTFKHEEFRNEYRGRVAKFIQAKAKGQHPRLPNVKERKTGGSLDQQLAKSLAAMRRGGEKKVA
jgi:DNA end-binding protein Ku